jgi:hypothetical protein
VPLDATLQQHSSPRLSVAPSGTATLAWVEEMASGDRRILTARLR